MLSLKLLGEPKQFGGWCRYCNIYPIRVCTTLTFIPRLEIVLQTLAHRLDSLVRVSRRDDKKHFVPVLFLYDRHKYFHKKNTCLFSYYLFKRKKRNFNKTLLPIGSFSAISGTLSLSFQSSFHLSLTVLVRYRSLTNI